MPSSRIALPKKRKKKRNLSHRQRIEESVKVLQNLRSKRRTETEIIEQMRAIDPYLFEEIILTSLGYLGYTVIRNPSYSHDGGIDGRAVIDGVPFLIQTKRYKGTITPTHMKAFVRQCLFSHCHGLFVHTGTTGRMSEAYASSKTVTVVSGQQLATLLAGNRPTIAPFKKKLTALAWMREVIRQNNPFS